MVNKQNEGKVIDLTKSKNPKVSDEKPKKKEDIKKELDKKQRKPDNNVSKEKSKPDKDEQEEYDKKRIIIIVIIIFGLILFLTGILLLVIKISNYVYQNVPGDLEKSNTSAVPLPILTGSSLNGVRQFYPNMKFNHNDISYRLSTSCSNENSERIITALDNITLSTGVIQFHRTLADKPDIEIICSSGESPVPTENSDFFIAGEGGAKEVIQTGRYNVINNGEVYIYSGLHQSPKCVWPNVEIHELIHVLGFNHSLNKNSLMYPFLESCSQTLDKTIIDELKRLYGTSNLADLYFDNVSAVKKGRYLDFNITVRNSGVIDAINASFTVLDNSVEIETKYLKDLKFGAGIVMEVKNFKLKSRDSDTIDIVLDHKNKIRELDENNNIAKIRF
jgi:hypothetical protein